MIGDKKRSFIGGAGIIMIATVAAKALGALYRIPLTNLVGAEGMGIYQTVYPVYALILSVSGGAVPMAISVLVASYTAGGEPAKGKRLTVGALVVMLATGAAVSVALILLGGFVASLQGAPEASKGYYAIAPSVLFVSGIAVLKGYFQGRRNMFPTALSQVTEAFGKLVFGLLFAWILLPEGTEFAVAGALIGVTVGEGATFLILILRFVLKEKDGLSVPPVKEARELYKEILRISVPIGAGGMIFPLTQFLDSFTVVNILSRTMTAAEATAAYGVFSAPVGTLINLPVSLAIGVGVAVAPHMAGSRMLRDIDGIRLKLSTSLKTAFALGVPFAALFAAVPGEVLAAIYPALSAAETALGSRLLRIGALNVLTLTITQISVSVLQGLGNTSSPVKNLALAGALKVGLGIPLMFLIGIEGVMWANFAAYLTAAATNLVSVFNLTGKNVEVLKKSGVMLLAGAIILLPAALVAGAGLGKWAVLGISAAAGAVYIALILLLPVFTRREMLSLPMGGKILILNEKLGIKRSD